MKKVCRQGIIDTRYISGTVQLIEQMPAEFADQEKVLKAAVALDRILRHPVRIQAIIGTMNPEHQKDACDAWKVTLSHHDWYQLYLAAGEVFSGYAELF